MRVLVTGGAGFIGTHLVRRLTINGHSVVILDNLSPQVHGEAPALDGIQTNLVRGDVRNAQIVSQAMQDVDAVYHLAAETGVGQSQYEIGRYVAANTHGTAVVLEAAAKAQVKQVIIASSRAVYGEGQHRCESCQTNFLARPRKVKELDERNWEIKCPTCGMAAAFLPMTEDSPPSPISIYGITKWQQEQLANSVAETYGMAVTTLRFFDVYGPGQSLGNPYTGVLRTFFRRATARQSIEVYEDGKMLRDFVFVADVVEALTRSLNNEKAFGAMLNVGLGQAITLHDIARQMFRSLKIEPQLGGSGRYRVGDIRHAVADVRRLQQTLDFVPQTSFVEGLQAYVDWALKQNSFASDEKAEKELANVALLRAAR